MAKGEPLSKPADKFVPEKLHEYGLYYEKKENAEDDKRWYQIATLAIDQYPNDPQGFKDAAGYWADIGEWQKARESFEKAHQLDPKSAVALIALGQISAEMKDFASARKFYEDALKLEPNGQYAQTAKEALRKLKKKPPKWNSCARRFLETTIGAKPLCLPPQLRHYHAPQATESKASVFFVLAPINCYLFSFVVMEWTTTSILPSPSKSSVAITL